MYDTRFRPKLCPSITRLLCAIPFGIYKLETQYGYEDIECRFPRDLISFIFTFVCPNLLQARLPARKLLHRSPFPDFLFFLENNISTNINHIFVFFHSLSLSLSIYLFLPLFYLFFIFYCNNAMSTTELLNLRGKVPLADKRKQNARGKRSLR